MRKGADLQGCRRVKRADYAAFAKTSSKSRENDDEKAKGFQVSLKAFCSHLNGRRERIRTSGPCLPKAVLYQAELLSVRREARVLPISSGPRKPCFHFSDKKVYYTAAQMK